MNDHWLETGAILIVIALAVLSRLVRSLLVHQQKMTQILQEGRNTGLNEERVLRELAELRALVAQQAITLGLLAKNQNPAPLAERLEEKV